MPGRKKRWVFTEWPRFDVYRTGESLQIGTNLMSWEDGRLEIEVNDLCPRQKNHLQGRLVFEPHCRFGESFALDGAGRHLWWPICPDGHFEAEFEQPGVRFSGRAYHDANQGEEPLERGLLGWHWSRLSTEKGTLVMFDGRTTDGMPLELARVFSRDGRAAAPPDMVVRKLPRTFLWAFPRAIRCQKGRKPRVLRTFEESPFYARSLVETVVSGAPVVGVHESLSLSSFCSPLMQKMLPYRVSQRGR